MPTRLLLEGSDIAELMEHVRAELGPHARIVHAERVRTGGIAGFFARERFELTIDVPDVPDVPLQRPRARRAVTAAPQRVAVTAGAADGVPPVPAPRGLDDLLAAADAVERTAPEVPGAIADAVARTDGAVPPDFDAVLTEVKAMAQAMVTRPPAGEHPRRDPALLGEPEPADEPVDEPVETPAAAEPPPPLERPAPPPPPPPVEHPSVAALRDVGVPEELLAAVPPGEAALLSALIAALPAPPALPTDPGALLVVVGGSASALPVAAQVAERAGRPRSSVVVAGSVEGMRAGLRLSSSADAVRWRSRPLAPDGITVVALGVGDGWGERRTAAAVLGALRPDHVWAVVDARTKPRDCRRWLDEVVGARPVAALAVQGLLETTQPATVLGLGSPVALMDGVPANRMAWAAVLGERLDTADWS